MVARHPHAHARALLHPLGQEGGGGRGVGMDNSARH
ncbi:hypothetical protein E2C01_076388 [Portunus trituberculatus]|uniref:Uncharacterized protein n=1 Tax=Portunus trituberculatus TaxID=210409 RepID=A0A5B7IHP1_PORTR|nr:hypothetical protein [Portunus trituberculatus]